MEGRRAVLLLCCMSSCRGAIDRPDLQACGNGRTPIDAVEGEVWGQVERAIVDGSHERQFLDQIRQQPDRGEDEKSLEWHRAEIKKIEAKVGRLVAKWAEEEDPVLAKAIEQQTAQAREEMKSHERAVREIEGREATIAEVGWSLAEVRDLFAGIATIQPTDPTRTDLRLGATELQSALEGSPIEVTSIERAVSTFTFEQKRTVLDRLGVRVRCKARVIKIESLVTLAGSCTGIGSGRDSTSHLPQTNARPYANSSAAARPLHANSSTTASS